GRWRFSRGVVLATIAFAVIATFLALWQRSGSGTLAAWFTAVPVGIGALVATLVALAHRVGGRRAAAAAMVVLATAVVMLARFHVPVPSSPEVNAASSLKATAGDLARFLVELARPTIGDARATRAMGVASQRIDDVSAWGLGIGVERHAAGRYLWHW